MTLESTATSTTNKRPTGWSYASPDLNVLLTGQLVFNEGDDGQLKEGAQFQLDEGGLYIEHPSLVSITTTPTGQTLSSLNTGQPIITLAVPLLPPSTSPSPPTSPTNTSHSPAPSSTTKQPTIVTLHLPLLLPSQLSSLEASPLYSTTFHLILDGPSFLPPHFDASSAIAPPTPQVGATTSLLNSPTIQRALLSPLLSPQRRAHSQGSDISVPPLSLGLSRGRAPSLSAPSGRPNTTSSSPSTVRSSSRTSRAPLGLDALLPPTSSKPSLDALLSSEISSRAKNTAEEIMALRRQHDAFVKRVRIELEVLLARVSNATNHAVAAPGGGLVVKGFGAESSKSRSPVPKDRRTDSLSREQSRERSVERGTSEERGRARAPGGSKKDEDVSREIRESDKREQEERGRSLSRARGRGEAGQRGESKTGKAVKEVVDQAAKAGKSPALKATKSPAIKPQRQKGEEIPASVEDDSAPPTPSGSPPSASPSSTGQAIPSAAPESVQSPIFVPSSHALVSIPESEELSLSAPPSESGGEETAELRGGEEQGRKQGEEGEGSEDEEENDTPFEMDEDIDVEELALPSSTEAGQATPEFDVPEPQPAPTTTQTFRPGSMARASSLSASYNALLNSSLANRRPSAVASSKSPLLPAARSPLPPPATSASSTSNSLGSTPPDTSHPTTTSAREDAQTTLAFIPRPDAQAARKGEQKIRDVLAVDVPSHRSPLPNKRLGRRRSSGGGGGMFDEHEEEEEEPAEDRAARIAVGSVPISIGFARPTTSTFRPPGERELQRKTSVPGSREGMFVPPLLRQGSGGAGGGGGQLAGVGGGAAGGQVGQVQPRRKSVGFVKPEEGSKAAAAQASSSSSSGAGVQPVEMSPPSTSSSSGTAIAASTSSRPSASNPSSSSALSSSLAQSLRQHPSGGVRSFSQVAEEEEEQDDDVPSPTTSKTDEVDEDDEDFVPPHEFVMRGRTDEQMLSRSVSSY